MTHEAKLRRTPEIVGSTPGSSTPGDERALVPLLEILLSRDPEQRRTAAFALGQISHPQIVAPLIKAVRDPDPEVRRWALLGLGRFRDPTAIPALLRSLREPGLPEREAAVTALALMGAPAIPALSEALRHFNPEAACAAAETLGRIADSRAVSPLLRALKTPDLRLRLAAAQALGDLAAANPVPEVRAALAPLRRQAWREEGAFYRAVIRRIEAAIQPTVHLPIPASQPAPIASQLPVPAQAPRLDAGKLPIPAGSGTETEEGTPSAALECRLPLGLSRAFAALFPRRRNTPKERS